MKQLIAFLSLMSSLVATMTSKLQELLDNEKQYIEDLKSAIEVYEDYGLKSLADPSLLQMPEDLKDGKFKHLFANIGELYEFHSVKVLPNMEQCIEMPELLYTLFTAWKREFCNFYGKYSASLNKLSSIFVANANYFEQVKQMANCQNTVDRLFLAPVHVIPRYELFVKDAKMEFSKGQDENNAEMMDKVLIELQDISGHCNEMIDVGYIINFEVNIAYKQD